MVHINSSILCHVLYQIVYNHLIRFLDTQTYHDGVLGLDTTNKHNAVYKCQKWRQYDLTCESEWVYLFKQGKWRYQKD